MDQAPDNCMMTNDPPGRRTMANLTTIAIFAGFFGGFGILFIGVGFLWWISLNKQTVDLKIEQTGRMDRTEAGG
ncbi:hypothetical protein GF324_09890 [bacterium]|nr:hypothetical protein [bacterium]